MAENKSIRAVHMVRKIRDELAQELSGMSNQEIIDYFKQMSQSVIRLTRKRTIRKQLKMGV
jgi:hypothetical protein